MANEMDPDHQRVGAWAKRYYFAAGAVMETALRPYGLGSTQWYVLYQLANGGPTLQRDLGHLLEVERATLSSVVTNLVGKGLIAQAPDASDQRQRMLRLTDAGASLWNELPNPIDLILRVAFSEADSAEMATAVRVLKAATHRLYGHQAKGNKS